MLEVWAWGSNSKGISTVIDTRTLPLKVLAAMGCRKSYKFCGLDRAGEQPSAFEEGNSGVGL